MDSRRQESRSPVSFIPYVSRRMGVLSIGSGLALIGAPTPMGNAFGLPAGDALRRCLGVRDVAIGLGLLCHRRAAVTWWIARTVSEAADATLILRNVRRNGAALARGRPKVLGALLAVGVDLGLTVGAIRSATQLRRIGRLRTRRRVSFLPTVVGRLAISVWRSYSSRPVSFSFVH
jgi:hypothetical protein